MVSFEIKLLEKQNDPLIKRATIEFVGHEPTNDLAASTLCLEKWNLIRDNLKNNIVIKPSRGSTDMDVCGYCRMYVLNDGDCDDCPIAEETGYPECQETPYWDYTNLKERLDRRPATAADIVCLIEYAEEEIAFLEGIHARIVKQTEEEK